MEKENKKFHTKRRIKTASFEVDMPFDNGECYNF
jgi:hypothetical protein